MDALLTITWDMPKGIDLGFFTLRFYSLLFASGFVLGYFLMKNIFKREGVSQEKLDSLVTYMVISTIVGARLGHVFFYQWDYYSQHPLEILMVWEGGLASHGAAIAIIIAILIYAKKVLKKHPLWMFDRLVIVIILAGTLIRLGNFFNSEIYGNVGNSGMEMVFVEPPRDAILRNFDFVESVDFEPIGETVLTDSVDYPLYRMQLVVSPDAHPERVAALIQRTIAGYINSFDRENQNILFSESPQVSWVAEAESPTAELVVMGVPRAPTQLYEALGYFLIFLLLYRLYLIPALARRRGFIFGVFLITVWGFRFAIEYAKENQVALEEGMSLNIGQWLSIPLVIGGLILILISPKNKVDEQ